MLTPIFGIRCFPHLSRLLKFCYMTSHTSNLVRPPQGTGTFGPVSQGAVVSPYRRMFQELPQFVQRVLWDHGFSRVQADAELLESMWEDEDFRDNLIQGVSVRCAVRTEEALHLLSKLVARVRDGQHSDTYMPWQQQWMLKDRCMDRAGLLQGIQDLEVDLRKWKHWKPQRVKNATPTTMRAMELSLRDRWSERLLARLLPVGMHLDNLAPLMTVPNPTKEAKHLLGITRFRTLRIHCLNLEFILKLGVKLPWTESSLRDILNMSQELELTTSRLNQMWKTVAWLAKKFGGITPDSLDRLVQKKQAVVDSLVSTTVAPQRKAVVPSIGLLIAMERALMCETLPFSSRLIMTVARFMAGSSARFNDIQHCRPKDIRLTSNSLEVTAWQSKTTGLTACSRRPCVLIAPQWSFSGAPWWTCSMTIFKKISEHPKFANMDFLLPTIGRDGRGLIARPCAYSRALRWLRDVLFRFSDDQQAATLTWHSMRVFMPDCAFQSGIPRDQRQYLGNWANESTADVYTRDKRNVVCKLWQDVCTRISTSSLQEGRQARVDLTHADYDGPKENLDSPASSLWERVSSSPGSEARGQPVSSGTVGPEETPGDQQSLSTPVKRPRTTACSASDRLPADEVPGPHGPLTVVCRVMGPNSSQKIPMHLLTPEGKAIGCGWTPSGDRIRMVLPEDFVREQTLYGECAKCFRFYSLPASWGTQTCQVDDEHDSSSGSLTDSSVDTLSDLEGVDLA